MEKIYTFTKRSTLIFSLTALLFTSHFAEAQSTPICGGVQQSFQNTSGSMAGFTGDFMLGSNGSNSFLVKDRVIASGVYTITTPTYQTAAGTSFIGYGFLLDGTEKVARAEVKVMYISTFNNEMTTVFLAQFVPAYNPGEFTADVCRAISLADLPGFPVGGRYRLRIELTPNTGDGQVGETITFDDFRTTGTFSQTPLPVNFIGFDVKKVGGNAQLTWKVAGEENVARYEVQRSTDGRNFSTISSIDRNGKDTYNFTDAFSSGNAVFYRIRNVDNDGKFKYSTIARFVNGRSDIVVKAFPQPAINLLTLQHPAIAGKALINISTADGRVIRSVRPANGSMQTSVDVSGLQSGVYLLRFDSGDGPAQTLKVVKQ